VHERSSLRADTFLIPPKTAADLDQTIRAPAQLLRGCRRSPLPPKSGKLAAYGARKTASYNGWQVWNVARLFP
jgi:hypothetical protein